MTGKAGQENVAPTRGQMGPRHLISGTAAGHHCPQPPRRSEVRVSERDSVTPLIRAMSTFGHRPWPVTADAHRKPGPSPSQTGTGGLSALRSWEARRGDDWYPPLVLPERLPRGLLTSKHTCPCLPGPRLRVFLLQPQALALFLEPRGTKL